MTQHIVMFKFKADVPTDVRQAASLAFKQGIEALPSTIPFILSVHVGFNINPAEQWDICLNSSFESLDEVKAYSIHPAHKAIASQLMQHIAERACVDYEL